MYYIIHFYGIQIQLYGNKAPKLGNFKVYIDSEYQETASVYNDSRLTQQLIFSQEEQKFKEFIIVLIFNLIMQRTSLITN
ncbi:MAG: hypothetical protein ACLR9T_02545 [Thomasclavelia sp.]|uniref:hypothetical protein n=1 Tax=Thomasclavelia sp. TaxID=3025757 RepID=UPI0039A203D9